MTEEFLPFGMPVEVEHLNDAPVGSKPTIPVINFLDSTREELTKLDLALGGDSGP
jgi:hypothetical protein